MDTPRSEWTVSSSCVNAVVQAAESLGCDTADLLSRCGIARERLTDAEARHAFERFYEFYIRAEQSCGSNDLGLVAGRIDHANRLNLQLFVQSLCRNFRDYLNLMPSALRFAGDIGEARIERKAGTFTLLWKPLWSRSSEHRYLSDQILCYASRIHDSVAALPIKPIRAEFSYPKPADTTLLEQTFGCDLEFCSAESGLVYEAECLDYSMISIYEGWDRAFEGGVRHLFAADSEADDFLTRLQAVVMRQLPTGELHIDRVAQALHLSRRTLQRRLKDRGTSFQEHVSDLRLQLAEAYLRDQNLSISEIAFLLGYSGHAAFTSAFRSLKGVPPREYRATLV